MASDPHHPHFNNPSNLSSPWPHLPSDVLTSIADRLDPTIGTLRLRSVCHSWRSSLSFPSSSSFHHEPTFHFPLKLPSPTNLLSSPPPHLSLLQLPIYYFSHPNSPSNGFLVKLHETKPNTFSLIDPLRFSKPSNKPTSSFLNLLHFSVSLISVSYVFEDHVDVDGVDVHVPIKKVVLSTDFFEDGDFVFLGLTDTGDLVLWRFGDENWTEIEANGRWFDDIVSHKGKFYASADKRGRLVMIDSRLKPIDLVHSLMYGCGRNTHLVGSNGDLYLVDRVWNDDGLKFEVFKLDEKGRFWDYELDLNGSVFFVGNDANFALCKKDYYGIGGCIRDCIYFIIAYEEGSEFVAVFDMKKSSICLLVENKNFVELYWPPWFGATALESTS